MVRPLARSTPIIAGAGTQSAPKPGGAEAAGRALCWRQSFDFGDCDLRDRGDNKLRHPHTAPYHEWLRPVVDQNDLNLAAIIGIDGPRGVQDGDAIASGKTGARPDLALVTGGKCDCNAVRDERPAPWRDFDRRIGWNRGNKIKPGGECALILRHRQIAGVRQPDNAHLDAIFAAHLLSPSVSFSAVAMRSIKARATSSFDRGGQDSMPCTVTK